MNEWPILTAAILSLITDVVWRSSNGEVFKPDNPDHDSVMSLFFEDDPGPVYAIDREGNLYRMHSRDAFESLNKRRIMLVQVFRIKTSQITTKLSGVAEDVT